MSHAHPDCPVLPSGDDAPEKGRAVSVGSGDLLGGLGLAALSLKAAARFVAEHHRHNRPPQGGLFAVGAKRGAQLVGVAIIGRPIARMLSDGETCEVTRLCTDGARNACSLLYGAAARAAKALGYRRIITYTLASEPGVSLRAAGWRADAEIKGQKTWSRPSRDRVQTDLFGAAQRPTEDKIRWEKKL
jgi:hypothetical protein